MVNLVNEPISYGNGTVNDSDGTVNDSDGIVNDKNGTVNDSDGIVTSLKILSAIRDNPAVTIEQIAELCGISKRTIAREIKKLREQGKIRRIGSDKTGHWEIQKP